MPSKKRVLQIIVAMIRHFVMDIKPLATSVRRSNATTVTLSAPKGTRFFVPIASGLSMTNVERCHAE